MILACSTKPQTGRGDIISNMDDRLPVSGLLSHTLVAFTIEVDNEFEHFVPHRTTTHNCRSLPWLVSMTAWLQFMQFVSEDGISEEELCRLTRLSTTAFRAYLTRMSRWWGYVTVSESFVRPTPGGLKASEAWRSLIGVIQKRWRERFSGNMMDQLGGAMQSLAQQARLDFGYYLPVLGYELLSEAPAGNPYAPDGARITSGFDDSLPVLLSKVLLAFAVEFERTSGFSFAMSANLLRLTGDLGVRVRDLPRLSGISKRAIEMALRLAQACGLGAVESGNVGRRGKLFVLTPEGQRARETYRELVCNIEQGWKTNFGGKTIDTLRELLERLVGPPTCGFSPLFEGLKPFPEGWRASLPKLDRLPHYPMILHRGGFPDGS